MGKEGAEDGLQNSGKTRNLVFYVTLNQVSFSAIDLCVLFRI